MIHIYKNRSLYAGTHAETRGLVMEFKGISGKITGLPEYIAPLGYMYICESVIQSATHWWRDTLPMEYVRETFQKEVYK